MSATTETDIRRKVELWLCFELNAVLGERVPPLPAFPSMGGNLDENGEDVADEAATPTGPYIGVRTLEAEERLAGAQKTWAMVVEVILIGHMADATSPAHAAEARAVRDCLVDVAGTAPGEFEPLALSVHGMEVMGGAEYVDQEDQSHGGAVRVALGVSG